jgi:hypothetical protein
MREDDTRVGEQPAPIARMMAALAQIDDQVEIHRAAGAEKDRRPVRRQARPVGGDQHIRRKFVLVLPADLAQAGRTDLLPCLDQQFGVEAEPATRLQHAIHRGDVDRVLALVVGGAAAVEALATRGQRPGRQPLMPLRLQPADDVAMAVAEHGRAGALLAPLGDQDRPAANRVGHDLAGEAESGQRRGDLVGKIGVQCRRALLDLALGRDRDTAAEIGGEPALVEIGLGSGDRGGAGHGGSRKGSAGS